MANRSEHLPVRERAGLAITVGRQLFSRGFSFTDAVNAARTVWREPLAVNKITWSSHGGGYGYYGSSPTSALGWYGALPGATYDYAREVRDPAFNSCVSVVLNWVCRQLSEPCMQVVRERAGSFIAIDNHPLLKLWEQPNPHYDGDALNAAIFKSYAVAGMAYLIKVGRARMGPPRELWWTPYWTMRPFYEMDGSEFIRKWRYRPDGRGEGTLLDPEDVIVVRFDLNPYDQGRTSSQPLWPILRSIFGDNEAETYKAAILREMGIPGHMLIPQVQEDGAYPDTITPETAQALERRWVEKFTGERRGSVIVTTARIEPMRLGMSPQDMAIQEVTNTFEARICAAIGVPPQVLHLKSGDASKTYANQIEARQAAYEDCITPFLARLGLALKTQLLPDFPGSEGLDVQWDYSRVPCMQENMAEKAKWVGLLVHRGVLTVDDARIAMGYEPLGGEAGEAIAPVGGVSGSTGAEEGTGERAIEGGMDEEPEREEE